MGLALLNWIMIWKLSFQQNGKPVFYPEIHFNISHSDHQVICGFLKELLGVDLEKSAR
jgi:phosphopantetheinyl transferase